MYSPVRLLGKVGLSTVAAKARPTVRDNGMYSTQYFWGMVNVSFKIDVYFCHNLIVNIF